MKNYLLTLLLLLSFSLSAQDQIVWNQAGVVDNNGFGADLAQTMDDFMGVLKYQKVHLFL